MNNQTDFFRSIISSIADLFFPRGLKCIHCHKEIFSSNVFNLCEDCLNQLAIYDGPFCKKCGRSIPENLPYDRCVECQQRHHYYDNGYTCCDYNGSINQVIMDYKFNGKSHLYFELSRLLYENISNKNIQYDYIIAVPQSKHKLKQRGFDHMLLIAQELASLTGKPVLKNYLIRSKKTRPLKTLNREERELEMQGAIQINPKYLKKPIDFSKKILIIDDIYTTGTTLNTCAFNLYKKGHSNIDILTIARGNL